VLSNTFQILDRIIIIYIIIIHYICHTHTLLHIDIVPCLPVKVYPVNVMLPSDTRLERLTE